MLLFDIESGIGRGCARLVDGIDFLFNKFDIFERNWFCVLRLDRGMFFVAVGLVIVPALF